MPYIVYETDGRQIIPYGIHDTQAAANSKASDDAAWSAYVGEVTGDDWNHNAQPGWFITTAGAVVLEIPPPSIALLKNAMWSAHLHLTSVWEMLHSEGAGHLWAEVVQVHDFCRLIHQSNFRIVSENPNNKTHAELTAYAEGLVAGPQDGSGNGLTMSQLFGLIIANIGSVGTEQGYTYVNPDNGDQITIVDAMQSSTRTTAGLGSTAAPFAVTETDLASGGWIENLT